MGRVEPGNGDPAEVVEMKIKFRVPVVTGKTYDIEGELTDEEANSLLEFAFLALLSRGVSPASIAPSVSAIIEETEREMAAQEDGTDDSSDDKRTIN